MGRKAGITADDVAMAAAAIADRDGLEAATLTAVAADLGIQTPSLYNHVRGLTGLRRLMAIHGSQLLLESFRSAAEGKSGREALFALAEADRRFATDHPGLFASFLPAPSPDEDEELYDALAQPIYLVAGVLLEMGIPQEKAIHLLRALWALLYGFLELEANGGFGPPVDLDQSFDVSIEVMVSGIEALARDQ